jgi:hypothetical protein
VYAILLLASRLPYLSTYLKLTITTDGTTFTPVDPPAEIRSLRFEARDRVLFWFINKSIRGWKLQNAPPAGWARYDINIQEIIVMAHDSTMPPLYTLYPDSIEIIDDGTTNLDSFSGLSNISDNNDNTYATFYFRGGYHLYTLYLKGEFSVPMAAVISPFVLIEINPLSSNIASTIVRDESSHGYFHWGAVDTLSYTSASIPVSSLPPPISNSPCLQWSQKVYEDYDPTHYSVRGTFTDSYLSPTGPFDDSRTGLIAPLNPYTIINNKTLYIPYFFSLRHFPIFIANQTDYMYYATNNITEPFVYTAANGSTGKIILKFGLRIQTTSSVSSNFAVKIYGMGFLCFPQMDFETPLAHPPGAVWYAHVPQGNVTRDNNEATESSDITTAEKFVSIYPTAVDVSPGSGRLIRFRIRSTSGGDSNFTVKRYYGFHRASDDTILWYSQDTTYNVGSTLQSFDVLGEDQYGQTKVIKVEIIPI